MAVKNLILQHHEGELPHCLELATKSVKEYAASVGAEYKFVTGYPFNKDMSVTCQKLCFFNEEYDEYDNVVLLDTDVVMKKDGANIFEQPGICYINEKAVDRTRSGKYPYRITLKLAGQLYKGTREERRLLRETFDFKEVKQIFGVNNHKSDEFIFFYLLYKSGLLTKENHITRDWTMELSYNRRYEDTHGYHFGPNQELIPEFIDSVYDEETLMDFKYKYVDLFKYVDPEEQYKSKTYYSHDYNFWG